MGKPGNSNLEFDPFVTGVVTDLQTGRPGNNNLDFDAHFTGVVMELKTGKTWKQ